MHGFGRSASRVALPSLASDRLRTTSRCGAGWEERFDSEIDDALLEHKAVCRESMRLLGALPVAARRSGFDAYRQVFFYRTATTARSVALVHLAAASRLDIRTMAGSAQNAFEESGCGDPASSHIRLLEDSHNRLAADVYDLPALAVADSDSFPRLTEAVREFRSTQFELYSSHDYCVVLGTSYAQEAAAVDMLQAILDYVFQPHVSHYSHSTYAELTKYFTLHLGGVEQQHAEFARQAIAERYETNYGGWRLALGGAQTFLSAQTAVWSSLQALFRQHAQNSV